MSDKYFIARSADEKTRTRTESGGAVTSILKYALKSGHVDGVVTVMARNGNRYDGVPVLIANPDDLDATTGSLHCSIPNISRFLKEYLNGGGEMKLAVVGKPCDIRSIIELQKRHRIGTDNLTLIGLNCTGTISPVVAKRMFSEEFKVDPRSVVGEDISNGQLTIFLEDGTSKSMNLSELEEKNLGRRENCRRCEVNIPSFADLAFGKWGTEDEKEGSTFIEIGSEKGRILLEGAKKDGFVVVTKAKKSAIEMREKMDAAEKALAKEWRERDFGPILELSFEDRLDYWMNEFSRCIKCYGCRDACPICYCDHCLLEAKRGFVDGGEIPPDTVFPLTRLAHVADSCVNCGQCQDACPMELPLSKLFSLLNQRLTEVFEYTPGMSLEDGPPLNSAMIEELSIEDTFLDIPALKRALATKSAASEDG